MYSKCNDALDVIIHNIETMTMIVSSDRSSLYSVNVLLYRVIFLTGSALKVRSVGDGKIPTKKVKVRVSHRENMSS